MRQYFDSLLPVHDTSGDSSISTPSQLSRSSPVPVLHLQRTGASVYLSLLLLSRLTWLILHVHIPFPIVLTICSPSHSLLPYSSLLPYPPLMLRLASILPSASRADGTKRHSASFRRLSLRQSKRRPKPRFFHRCSARCKRKRFSFNRRLQW